MQRCRLCTAQASTHINYGMALHRFPASLNGWYCKDHQDLPAIEKQTALRQQQKQTNEGERSE